MTCRAVGYSRCSTDHRHEPSIKEQEALIRCHAERIGFEITLFYSHSARSGASMFSHDGLLKSFKDSRAGGFDALIVAELARLFRFSDMYDLKGLHKRLFFARIGMIAVPEGVAFIVTVGFHGVVGQPFREDNARKARRGLCGTIARVLSAGGRTYGYKHDSAGCGELNIDPEEKAVNLRVFEEFLTSKPPCLIARDIINDLIPSTSGGKWSATSIYGREQCRSDRLQIDPYGGRLVWIITTMVNGPETVRQVPRTNPFTDWRSNVVPQLRMMPYGLWTRVEEMLQPNKGSTMGERSRRRRPTRHLSGPWRCGVCGARMSVKCKYNFGRERMEYSRQANSRSCPALRTYRLDRIETAVIDKLREQQASPQMPTIYVDSYNSGRREYAAGKVKRSAEVVPIVAQLDNEINRPISFMASEISNDDRPAREHDDRCSKHIAAQAELALVPERTSDIALHPKAVERYRRDPESMAMNIAAATTPVGLEAAQILRRLVQAITVQPGKKSDKIEVTLTGFLRDLFDAPHISGAMSEQKWRGTVKDLPDLHLGGADPLLSKTFAHHVGLLHPRQGTSRCF